jgi:hypothetical protein
MYDLKALGAERAASIQAAVTQRLIYRKEAKNNEKQKLDSKMHQKMTNITEYTHNPNKKKFPTAKGYEGCFRIHIPTMVHVSTVGVRN